jgi:hypothetical protein
MVNASTTTTSAGAERRKAVPNGEIRLNGAATADRAQAGLDQKEHDFFWTYTEEPHRTRRLAIIKAHPEVRTAAALVVTGPMLTLELLNRSLSSAAPSH